MEGTRGVSGVMHHAPGVVRVLATGNNTSTMPRLIPVTSTGMTIRRARG